MEKDESISAVLGMMKVQGVSRIETGTENATVCQDAKENAIVCMSAYLQVSVIV